MLINHTQTYQRLHYKKNHTSPAFNKILSYRYTSCYFNKRSAEWIWGSDVTPYIVYLYKLVGVCLFIHLSIIPHTKCLYNTKENITLVKTTTPFSKSLPRKFNCYQQGNINVKMCVLKYSYNVLVSNKFKLTICKIRFEILHFNLIKNQNLTFSS